MEALRINSKKWKEIWKRQFENLIKFARWDWILIEKISLYLLNVFQMRLWCCTALLILHKLNHFVSLHRVQIVYRIQAYLRLVRDSHKTSICVLVFVAVCIHKYMNDTHRYMGKKRMKNQFFGCCYCDRGIIANVADAVCYLLARFAEKKGLTVFRCIDIEFSSD